jgi:hypothetical protein
MTDRSISTKDESSTPYGANESRIRCNTFSY